MRWVQNPLAEQFFSNKVRHACVRIWSGHSKRATLLAWRWVSAVLIAGGLTYTILATPARIRERINHSWQGGLNGARFMSTARYSENGRAFELRWDYKAIRWLQDKVEGTPVIAEGRSEREYQWGNRIAVHTGLPAILGWRNHELQQRSILPPEVVERRAMDVDAFYRDPETETALRIIDRYNIQLIYVGSLERAYYPGAGLAKFDRLQASGHIKAVYSNPRVVIYAVN